MARNNHSALLRIESAFARFEQSVTSDDARSFRHTELSDVRQAAIDIQEWQRRKKSFHNMRRIEPLLTGIEKYSKVLDVLCNGTPFLSWIWAPIKLMLQLATDHISSLESLIDAYARIAECLPRFDRYTRTFPTQEMQDVLALVYEDILEFHRTTYKFFRRRAWKVLFDCTWVNFQHRFGTLLHRLRQHQDLVDKEVVAFDVVEASQARAKIDAEFERNEKERIDLHLQSVLTWFGVSGSEQEDYLWHLQAKHYAETCNWFLKDSRFETWLNGSSKHSLLWLWGKPGSGKSVTCAYIVHRLRKRCNTTILYYFFDHRNRPADGDRSHLLRALGSQIIRLNTDLAPLIWENYIRKGHSTSLEHLHTALPELISASYPVRMVVDGLDEAVESEHSSLIDSLLRLTEGTNNHSRVLICCRNLNTIARKLRNYPAVSFADEQISLDQDIAAFVRGRLDDLIAQWDLNLSDSTKLKVTEVLCHRSNGMFLWVDLVMNEFQYTLCDEDVLGAIERLPHDLYQVYTQMLFKIRKIPNLAIQQKIFQIFEWLTYATRPLGVLEILNAIGCYHWENMQTGPRLEPSKLLDFCKPVIEFTHGGKVIFVHFTVKEYFLDQASEFHLNSHSANTNLAITCLHYIQTSSIFMQEQGRQHRLLQIVKGERSLHSYVFSNWLFHLENSGEILRLKDRSNTLSHVFEAAFWHLRSKKDHAEEGLGATRENVYETWDALVLLQRFQAFHAKSKAIEADSEDIEVSLKSKIQQDPTLLTAINSQYTIDLENLLDPTSDKDLLANITADMLASFRSNPSLHVFVCRYTHCVSGFTTVAKRQAHESLHRPLLRCEVVTCFSSERGFKTARQLALHKQKYHSEMIPDIMPSANNLKPVQLNELNEKLPDSTEQLGYEMQPHSSNASQVNRYIMQSLQQDGVMPTGTWQAGVLPQERMNHIRSLVDSLRWLGPDLEMSRAVDVSINFERKEFNNQPTKEDYQQECQQKLKQISDKRQAITKIPGMRTTDPVVQK